MNKDMFITVNLALFVVVNRESAIFSSVNRELGYGDDREFALFSCCDK